MNITRKIALGISLTATAFAGAAYAEQSAKQDRRDAPVTRAEAQAKAQEHFARMDVNKDGKVDQADRAARRAAMFDRIDTDRNGQISRAEFDGAHQRGTQAAGRPEGERGPGMRGHGGPGRGHWGHRGGGKSGFGPGADANKDGAVTQAEFTQAALARFDRTDANKDGTVTKEERQAARQAMREQWQKRAGAPATPKAN